MIKQKTKMDCLYRNLINKEKTRSEIFRVFLYFFDLGFLFSKTHNKTFRNLAQ